MSDMQPQPAYDIDELQRQIAVADKALETENAALALKLAEIVMRLAPAERERFIFSASAVSELERRLAELKLMEQILEAKSDGESGI